MLTGFLYDDRALVTENEDLRPASTWAQLLVHDYWGTPLSDPRSHTSWRPATVASLKLNFHLAGLEPWPYHATNLALHACVCALVTVAAAASTFPGETASGCRRRTLLSGLVFAAHPIHTEAVDNVAGRAELLAAVFALLSFVAFAKADQLPKRALRLGARLVRTVTIRAFTEIRGSHLRTQPRVSRRRWLCVFFLRR